MFFCFVGNDMLLVTMWSISERTGKQSTAQNSSVVQYRHVGIRFRPVLTTSYLICVLRCSKLSSRCYICRLPFVATRISQDCGYRSCSTDRFKNMRRHLSALRGHMLRRQYCLPIRRASSIPPATIVPLVQRAPLAVNSAMRITATSHCRCFNAGSRSGNSSPSSRAEFLDRLAPLGPGAVELWLNDDTGLATLILDNHERRNG